jgi:hypothetical protein
MFVGSEELKDKRRGFKMESAGSRIASYFNEAALLFVSAARRERAARRLWQRPRI